MFIMINVRVIVLDSVNKYVTLYIFWMSIDNFSSSSVDNRFNKQISNKADIYLNIYLYDQYFV